MGMLSLTPQSLLFYPMMSSNAKVVIPMQDIRGVKKAGRMGGLRVKYVVRGDEPQASQFVRKSTDDLKRDGSADLTVVPVTSAANGEPLEREEKFGWISGRDEVFAKLVGWGGRRWVKM
jgi:GRAM domain-containing protein 4